MAVPTLEGLRESGHEVCGVFTQPAKPQGRKQLLTPTPVATYALSRNIPIFTPVTSTEIQLLVSGLKPDIAVVVAYGKILDEATLASVSHGWWNVHFSLLPRWRGATPVQHTLLAGDENAGISVFRMVPELDAGPLASTAAYRVNEDETAGALLDRLATQAPSHVLDVLAKMVGGSLVLKDQKSRATFAPKLAKEAGELNLAKDCSEVMRRFRAVTPEPGAVLARSDTRTPVKILHCRPDDGRENLSPGQLKLSVLGELLAGTATNPVVLEQVKPAGKSAMSGAEWLRGEPDGVSFYVP